MCSPALWVLLVLGWGSVHHPSASLHACEQPLSGGPSCPWEGTVEVSKPLPLDSRAGGAHHPVELEQGSCLLGVSSGRARAPLPHSSEAEDRTTSRSPPRSYQPVLCGAERVHIRGACCGDAAADGAEPPAHAAYEDRHPVPDHVPPPGGLRHEHPIPPHHEAGNCPGPQRAAGHTGRDPELDPPLLGSAVWPQCREGGWLWASGGKPHSNTVAPGQDTPRRKMVQFRLTTSGPP